MRIARFLEAFVLSLFFYLVLPNMFSNSYLICLLVGLGFATIGEVILVAVLTEFKLTKTKFGQLKLGMEVTDDFFFLWIFLGMLLISGLFLEEMMIIGAIFAGIMCQNLFPEKMFRNFEMKYQFLMIFVSPFFFFNIGYKIDLALINFSNIGWIASIILISVTTRVISSVILFRKQLGFNESIIFSFGLCAKFSTSVIVLSLLVDFGYITPSAYSFLMIAFLIMKIFVVFIYSIGTSKIRMATINTEDKNPSLQTG